MHGRVKVKSSAQQEAEKARERAGKLAAYRAGMAAVLGRRREGVKDAKQLQLSSQILLANPDIHSLWNLRREVLLHLASTQEQETQAGQPDELLKKDVELTQACLAANPKSYGAWHHRCWCLERMVSPDLVRELALTEKFLQLDSRNFHCWDYRKAIAEKARQEPREELQFCRKMINNNFSNYSAWHTRSKLLPLAHRPGPGCLLEEGVHHEELELVQNAAFTDPDDSSAWFYHTWLVEACFTPSTAAPSLPLYLLSQEGRLHFAATSPVSPQDFTSKPPLSWEAENEGVGCSLWTAALPEETLGGEVAVVLEGNEETLTLENVSATRSLAVGSGLRSVQFYPPVSEATLAVLEEELSNCNQLLELEPQSKWTNFTKAMLLKTINFAENFHQILETLEALKSIDHLRVRYYEDMISKLSIERALEQTRGDYETLDLTGRKLHRLFHLDYLRVFRNILQQ